MRNVISNAFEGGEDPIPEDGDNKPVHELGQPQPDCSCDTCCTSRHIQATVTAVSYPGERWPTKEETASQNARFTRDCAEYREARRITYWHMALAMFCLLSSLAIRKGNEPGDEVSTSTALISGRFANTNFGRSRSRSFPRAVLSQTYQPSPFTRPLCPHSQLFVVWTAIRAYRSLEVLLLLCYVPGGGR